MTKNVLFYARYSIDRQHEVSIETQSNSASPLSSAKAGSWLRLIPMQLSAAQTSAPVLASRA